MVCLGDGEEAGVAAEERSGEEGSQRGRRSGGEPCGSDAQRALALRLREMGRPWDTEQSGMWTDLGF